MLDSSSQSRFAYDRDGLNRAFVSSHKALAVCTREFTRLTDEVAERVAALELRTPDDRPDVRVSPGRCIIQLGPVALTIAWLRSTTDTVADGQLMVIVWRGTMLPRAMKSPERPSKGKAQPAPLAVWERDLAAAATSEHDWSWNQVGAELESHSSSSLAAACVDRLFAEYAGCATAA